MTELIRAYLNIHPLMTGLNAEQLDVVASRGALVRPATGDYLFRAGDKIDAIYLVHAGRVALDMEMPNGVSRHVLTVGGGGQVGVVAAMSEELDLAFDALVEEHATLIRIATEEIKSLMDDIPVLRRNILRSIGKTVAQQYISPKLRLSGQVTACLSFEDTTRDLVPQVTQRLAKLGENVAVITDQPDRFDGQVSVQPIYTTDGNWMSVPEVRGKIAEWKEQDRIFIDVGDWTQPEELRHLINATSQCWWISSSKSSATAVSRLRDMIGFENAWREKILFIWALQKNEPVSPWIPDLDSLIQRDFKIWLNPPDTENFNQKRSLCRLIHWIRGVQIGLALGGGAARGMAHLGVFQALEDAGIVVDRIAGTSAGALSGIPYASGLTPQYCTDSFTRDLKPEWYFDKMPGGDSLYMLAKYRKKAWDGMLRKYLHDWRLEQSVVPACSVAADLIESRQYIRDRGDMVQGILESINLPVLSPPICRDGMALVDGGILNVLPANVLVDQGCNFVIGVNVSSKISHSFAGNTPETPTDKMNTPGVMATLLRVLTVLDRNMSAIGASAADFTINPDVADLDPAAFQETPQIAAKGRLAADQAIGQLREMLQRLDAGLFGE